MMRTTWSDLDRGRESESNQGHAADQRRLRGLSDDTVQGSVSVGTPRLPEEDMEQEVLSLSICL